MLAGVKNAHCVMKTVLIWKQTKELGTHERERCTQGCVDKIFCK